MVGGALALRRRSGRPRFRSSRPPPSRIILARTPSLTPPTTEPAPHRLPPTPRERPLLDAAFVAQLGAASRTSIAHERRSPASLFTNTAARRPPRRSHGGAAPERPTRDARSVSTLPLHLSNSLFAPLSSR